MPNQGITLARKLLRLLCLVGIHDFQTIEVTVGRTSWPTAFVDTHPSKARWVAECALIARSLL